MASSPEVRITMLEAEVARKTQMIMDLEMELSYMAKPLEDHIDKIECEKYELECEIDFKDDQLADLMLQMQRLHFLQDRMYGKMNGLSMELAAVQELSRAQGAVINKLAIANSAPHMPVAQSTQLVSKHHYQRNETEMSLELAGNRGEVAHLHELLRAQGAIINQLANNNGALHMQVAQSMQLVDKHYHQRFEAKLKLKAARESWCNQEADFARQLTGERLDAVVALQEKDDYYAELKKELQAVTDYAHRLEAGATTSDGAMNHSTFAAAHAKLPTSSIKTKNSAVEATKTQDNLRLESNAMPGVGLTPSTRDSTSPSALAARRGKHFEPLKASPKPAIAVWSGMTLNDIEDPVMRKELAVMAALLPGTEIRVLFERSLKLKRCEYQVIYR